MQAFPELRDLREAGVHDGNERRQFERPARTVDPRRIGLGRGAQRGLVADRARNVWITRYKVRSVGEHSYRNARMGAIVRSGDVARIDEPEPAQHARGAILMRGRLRHDVAPQIRPRGKAVVARHARLRVVQAEIERDDVIVAAVGGGRKRVTKPRERVRVAVAVEVEQILGLLLEMIEIHPIGQSVHGRPPCIYSPKARNTGCTKALSAVSKAASGFNPSRGPGCGLQPHTSNIWRVWRVVNSKIASSE